MEAPSRRNFSGFGIGLAGLALLGSFKFGSVEVNAQGKYDNMELLRQHLPPAILNCRDRAIRILDTQEVASLWDDFGRVSYRMASGFDGYHDSVIVKPWSRKIEPAWCLLREQMNYGYGFNTTFHNPGTGVPQMLACLRGRPS